jgi:SAM-dependent methyltransferase
MDVEQRAFMSGGASSKPIYEMVAGAVRAIGGKHPTVVDCGCGTGGMLPYLGGHCGKYIGIDVVLHPGFPADAEFLALDASTGAIPLPDGSADLAIAVETIEHVENPRAFMRELFRIVKSGGWLIVTTPNQMSALSLMSLVLKGRFAAFSDRDYPAHISALLETDLRRIAGELGLEEVEVAFSRSGRIPFTAWHFPGAIAALAPRRLSDNVLIRGRKSQVSR